jgi:vacuolar iron transporter family protein
MRSAITKSGKATQGKEVKPNRFQIWLYTTISRLFGFTFGFKLMELGEEKAQVNYEKIAEEVPEAREVIQDESDHEDKLLIYVGRGILDLRRIGCAGFE